MTVDTLKESASPNHAHRASPGVVVVFTTGRPACTAFVLDGHPLVFGREPVLGAAIDDPRMSRRHAELSHGSAGWTVRDLGSRNGTSVDGRVATSPVVCERAPVVRFGRTVALAVPDVTPFTAPLPMRGQDVVIGPTLRAALAEIAVAAAAGADLLVLGESGSGKEMAAKHFHRAGPHSSGPLIAVNCAAIPTGIAERLLFGTVKGAYSGASTEALGYVRSADGGVLFLDEFGELDLDVQAKLLRVIETKEVIAVGASRGRRVDASFCLATNRDLRAAVSEGKFRGDLYYRVTQAAVAVPPLRERREEIPWLVQLAVEGEAPGVAIDAELVEACMLRPWPGNVRELLGEIRRVARVAQTQSAPLRPLLLAPEVGRAVVESAPEPHKNRRLPVTAAAVVRALHESRSVSAAALVLGIHRSHLYRLIRQFGIDVNPASPSSD